MYFWILGSLWLYSVVLKCINVISGSVYYNNLERWFPTYIHAWRDPLHNGSNVLRISGTPFTLSGRQKAASLPCLDWCIDGDWLLVSIRREKGDSSSDRKKMAIVALILNLFSFVTLNLPTQAKLSQESSREKRDKLIIMIQERTSLFDKIHKCSLN